MSITTLVLILALVLGAALLLRMIRNDGHGRPTPAHQPPRSHVPDEFEHLAHL